MKGPKLTINILVSIALILISFMVALNLYPSWSEYARSREEQLLLGTLGSIMAMFFIRAYSFEGWMRVLFVKPVKADVRQINIWTAFMFLGIICTPVTIGEPLTEVMHYTVTLAAILFAYADVTHYYRSKISRTLGWIGFGLAVLGMVGGKLLGWWTLAVGEMIAAFPIVVHVLTTNNFKKK